MKKNVQMILVKNRTMNLILTGTKYLPKPGVEESVEGGDLISTSSDTYMVR